MIARCYARPVESREIGVDTPSQPSARDLTSECTGFLADVAGGEDGLLNVFVPHATAGLLVMELGSGSDQDLLDTVAAVLRRDDRWRHRHGSPGHGADHVLPLLAAPSVTIPVLGGRMALGTWQSIALLDTNPDNTRRRVRLSFIPG